MSPIEAYATARSTGGTSARGKTSPNERAMATRSGSTSLEALKDMMRARTRPTIRETIVKSRPAQAEELGVLAPTAASVPPSSCAATGTVMRTATTLRYWIAITTASSPPASRTTAVTPDAAPAMDAKTAVAGEMCRERRSSWPHSIVTAIVAKTHPRMAAGSSSTVSTTLASILAPAAIPTVASPNR
jgi:hypothetical protein